MLYHYIYTVEVFAFEKETREVATVYLLLNLPTRVLEYNFGFLRCAFGGKDTTSAIYNADFSIFWPSDFDVFYKLPAQNTRTRLKTKDLGSLRKYELSIFQFVQLIFRYSFSKKHRIKKIHSKDSHRS